MNPIIKPQYDFFRYYQAIRGQIMDVLDDKALTFSVGGKNPPLGALCREIGQVQRSYIDSFKSFKQDWSYAGVDPMLESSIDRLKEWYVQLDGELEEVVSGLSEDQLQNQTIDRGEDFHVRPSIQLEIYKEALLIFYGKSAVYLKAMEVGLPRQMAHWIT